MVVIYLSSFALVKCNIENLDLNYTSNKETYDELYTNALNAYDKDDHLMAATYLERAIADYHHTNEVKAQCKMQCDLKFKKIQTLYSNYFTGELNYLHYFIKLKSCSELCAEKFLGRRQAVAGEVRDLFEKREPYNYLQYSYYKVSQFNS